MYKTHFLSFSLNKIVILQRFRSFSCFSYYLHLIEAFGLSLASYNTVLFVILL